MTGLQEEMYRYLYKNISQPQPTADPAGSHRNRNQRKTIPTLRWLKIPPTEHLQIHSNDILWENERILRRDN